MAQPLDSAALDQLFDKARTNNKWQPREVPDDAIEENCRSYEVGSDECQLLAGANCLRQIAGSESAAEAASQPRQCRKTMAAPATAILAYDLNFYEYLPRLYPPADAKSWFAGKKEHADMTAFRNGSLQGGYFILAARALGLDCGPMSGFNNAGVDAEFFRWNGNKVEFPVQSGLMAIRPEFIHGLRDLISTKWQRSYSFAKMNILSLDTCFDACSWRPGGA